MKKEVAKMIRAEVCRKIGNHEYQLYDTNTDVSYQQRGYIDRYAYICKHCNEIAVFDRRLTKEEIKAISMKWKAGQTIEDVVNELGY